MHAVREQAELPLVADEEERGQRVKARMDRMGISARALSDESGVYRSTLKRAIEGESGVRAATFAAIEATLDRLEEEMGIGAPVPEEPAEADFIEFRVEGLYGAKSVVVKGPVRDRDALLEAVERLMRGAQESGE